MSRPNILYKTNGKCAYCGCTLKSDWQVDHMIPKSSEGTNDIDNLWPCCPTCNASKSVMSVEQFRKWVEDVPLRANPTARLMRKYYDVQPKQITFYFETLSEKE